MVPGDAPYEPAGHSEQAVAPAELHVPGGQSWQLGCTPPSHDQLRSALLSDCDA